MNDAYCENFISCSSRYVTDIGETETLSNLVMKLKESCDLAILGGDGRGILTH